MKINQLKAGAMLSYLSMGLGYLVSLVYTPIMLRLLGQSEYGLYNLVASVVAYLGILNFGFGSAYMRYYLRYKVKNEKDNIARLNGMFLIIFSSIGLITVFVGVVLVFNTELIFGSQLTVNEISIAKILMMILVVNLAFTFPNIIFNSYINANEEFIFQKLLQIIKMVVSPFVILPILYLGYGSIGMVLSTTVLNLLIAVANVYYCFSRLKMQMSFKGFDLSLMKEMSLFSFYIFLNMIIDQINWNVDKYILGRIHGTVSVAVYGLATQLNFYYISASTAISNVFIPRVNKIVATNNDNNTLTKLMSRIGRIQFILLSLILTGIFIFGKPFINLWAGENYNDSYIILLILILPATIPLIQTLGYEIQKSRNMHRFRSLTYFYIAIANVLISIPLAVKFQGTGAALGTAVSLFVGNGLLMNWYYNKRMKLNMIYFWSEIVKLTPTLLLPVICGIILRFSFNLYKIIPLMFSIIIYIIIFFLSLWRFGMNEDEKNLIAKPLLRIFNIKKVH